MLIWVIVGSILLANTFGVALHFTHRQRTRSFILHIFSAVNESTWEHLKLAFIPMLVISFIQYFILKNEYNNVMESNLYAILIPMIFIPIVYYSVQYFVKREVLWISIGIFILTVILGYVFEYFLILKGISCLNENISFGSLILLFICFAVFTFLPPKIFLFKDPVTNTYGHRE